jgi:hypothetical protein
MVVVHSGYRRSALLLYEREGTFLVALGEGAFR